MRRISVLMGIALISLAGSAAAQVASPGYYPIEEMGIIAAKDLEVDVDLGAAVMQVAAGAMEAEDQELAEMVSKLERVRVQVGQPSAVDAAAVTGKMADAMAKLEGAGWRKILGVEEDTEQVYFYVLEQDGAISGITGFVNDAGEEVVAVNIVGDIDPRMLGRVLAKVGDLDLDEVMQAFAQTEDKERTD
jgi:hypothetical protein